MDLLVMIFQRTRVCVFLCAHLTDDVLSFLNVFDVFRLVLTVKEQIVALQVEFRSAWCVALRALEWVP
jgi:hypothetical protein